MLLAQEAQAARRSVEIRVFATDVDRTALEEARLGVYPAGIAECVPPKRLARFFEKQGDTFRVAKRIRESLVFSVQDVLRDPPFSRLDLITCRNLLIYLETDVQQKVLALFHFALGEGGYLMLGNAETVGRQEDLFKPISKKWRIYRRLGPVRIGRVDFPVAPPAPRPATAAPPGPWPQQRASPADLALQALAAQYAPAAVLVDHHYQALYFHGPTERYLTPPQGVSTRDLLAMAREGLHTKLRAALRTAVKTHRTATAAGARVKRNGTTRGVTVHVTPLKAGADAEGLLLVSFEDEPAARGAPHPRPSITEKALVRQLEHELKVVQQELQGTLREMEGANEQLKVSNEEVISMNEELQSSNEELETSKEELQSLNEELSTVNTQLQAKVDELQEANETVTNLLASTDIATLFLDKAGRIRWFSPAAGKLLNLLAADVGRPVSHFAQKLTAGDLPADAAATLENLAPVEKELRTDDGRWYLRRVFPYRTQDGKVEGVVVTFTEITALRHSQEKERRLATVVRDSNDAILVLDLKGAIVAWNRGAEQMYRCTAAEAIGRHIREFIPEDKVKEFEEILARLAAGIAVPSWEAQRRTGDGRVLDVWITASPLAGDAGPIEAIATTERNITARKYTEAQLRRLNEALERQVAERTRVAEHRAEQLRTLAMRLAQTESRERRRLARHLHDNIQQILTGTRFYVNVLKRKTQDDETREATQSIEALLGEALEALRSLTLELSPPVLYEAGLGAGLQWLARWCHGKLGLKVDVRADPAAEPPTEDIRIMLFSAVRELLFNVRKHAHVDAARVTLGLADKDFIAVTVSDEGQGFDPDRIDAGNEDTSASGLGLFGIRERLSAWGGDVKVEASPGHGARVTLLMPVEHLARFARRPELLTAEAPGPAAQPAGATPDGAAVSTGRARGRAAQAAIPGKIRTLLVDDHRVVRQALARLLAEEPDIEVVGEADDGKAATELVRVIRPDVVVMDVSMPGMNGIDATAAITKEFPDIRVIGLSMHGEGDLPAKILDAGAVTCLGKGGPSDDLVAAIRAAGKAAPPDGHPPKR
jgi:two-component system CheB/CheR fusion protein